MNDEKLTPQQAAEMAAQFAESKFGKHYLTTLSLKYNSLHHEAEGDDLTAEQKAFRVERAAGLKVAIDYFSVRKQFLDSGSYSNDEEQEAPADS